MARRDGRATAATVEVALALDDLTLEPDERAAAVVTDAAAVALDDAAKLRRVEDVAGERRVRGDRLDAVDKLCEREFVGFEMREEVERVTETGTVRAREVPRVQAEGGQEWSLTPALNEVVVQGPKRGHGQGVEMEVRVDGSLYTAGHADGLLVATPTGSTAYNMSEDGPLVQPGVPGFIVNDMCATDTMPPLVVPLDAEITVRVDGADEIVVSADGASRYHVEIPEIIGIAGVA